VFFVAIDDMRSTTENNSLSAGFFPLTLDLIVMSILYPGRRPYFSLIAWFVGFEQTLAFPVVYAVSS